MSTVAKSDNTGRASREQSEIEELRGSLNRLMEATAGWKAERAQILEECEQLREALNGNEEAAAIALERQISTSVERIRAELTAENERIRQEFQRLQGSSSAWETERTKLLAELDHTRQLMGYTEQAAAIALERQMKTAVEKVKAEQAATTGELKAQILELETQCRENDATIESLRNTHRLATAEAEQRIADAVNEARMDLIADRDQLRQELEAAIQLSAQRASECAQLAAERDRALQASAETVEAERQATAQTLEQEIASAVTRARQGFEAESDALRLQWDATRENLESEIENTKASLRRAEMARANALADSEASERKNSKLMDDCVRLRQELEKLAETISQKDIERERLKEECDRANRRAAEAHSATAPQNTSGSSEILRAELARVEGSIQELNAVIEDPTTDLSVVIRKTVERAQMESYLNGLRFSMTAG